MAERIYYLPEEFTDKQAQEVSIHYYETSLSSQKNKVCFNQNLLCLLLEGNKKVFRDSGYASFDNSKFMLLQPGNTLMTERTTVKNTYKSILFFFSNSFLADFAKENNLQISPGDKNEEPLKLFKKDTYIYTFEKSVLLLQNRPPKALIKSKLTEILLYLLERNPIELTNYIHQSLSEFKDTPFKLVIESQENFGLTNEELAFLCNMSLSSFKRKFSKIYQTTPKQYYIAQRMDKAAQLLQNDYRPSEIYFELGYENQSAFSTEFKKYFGTTPKAFKLEKMSL